jgi:hypothetical protein
MAGNTANIFIPCVNHAIDATKIAYKKLLLMYLTFIFLKIENRKYKNNDSITGEIINASNISKKILDVLFADFLKIVPLLRRKKTKTIINK